MTDKKLTDNEIKSNLEWLKTVGDRIHSVTIGKEFIPTVIDYINRLEAQNERDVKVKVEALYKVNELKLENERLKTEKDNLIKTYSECQVANLQNFMQRVENKLANNIDISMLGYQSVICDMEETYKEMVGEDND